MPYVLNKLTPNLVVSDLQRSLEFYRDVLGFTVAMAVPDNPPYVFAGLKSGVVEIFLNALEPAAAEYPPFKGRPIGGTLTLFIDVAGIRQTYDALKSQVKIVLPGWKRNGMG